MAPSSKRALIAVSSYNEPFYKDGSKTGVFVVEALHPFDALTEKGFEVDIVSETGSFGYDEHSLSPDFLNGRDLEVFEDPSSKFNMAMANVKRASDLRPEDYSIFFASAGHATLYDYPKAGGLHVLASKIYANGGVVAAVCHGPAIFEGLMDESTGKHIIQGKSITGFTDVGEKMLDVDSIMEADKLHSIEDVARICGAKYLPPIGPWDDYSVTDGRIVTGVNPASAHSTAVRAINALRTG
ncbi:LADA_0C12904g1_1 [Lachancea dasiensis]|uniref:D-lactate dehydratase n=1 Tax=Lachancea dasiensis TaxID=1072105 RepID=A0A1G4J1Z3_9SACH|nr:LADA_0C12904g1_1 [Lachancea dasiensis]